MKKIIIVLLVVLMLGGCGTKNAKEKQLNLSDLLTEVSETYVSTFMVEKNDSDFYAMFEVDPMDIKQYVYDQAFLDVKSDELVFIQVNDKSIIPSIKEKLQIRMDEIVKEFDGYIDSEKATASAGIIFEKGSYVFMLINEKATDIQDEIIRKLE